MGLILVKYFRIGDVALLAFFAALVVWSGLIFWTGESGNVAVCQTSDETFRISLHKDQTIELDGPLGQTIAEVRNGKVRIIASPCPNESCVRMGEIWRHNQFVACLPNQVVISVEAKDGSKERAPDAITH